MSLDTLQHAPAHEARYHGLRMSVEEYLALGEDPVRYELMNGVVCMSPSPSFLHQKILTELAKQLAVFLEQDEQVGGEVAVEVDVPLLGKHVYRPDVIYLSQEKAARCTNHVTEVPDIVVEVISPDSRSLDTQTKRQDYERAGVGEYWLIDPIRKTFAFCHLHGGKFVDLRTEESAFQSQVLPGFTLDLERLRRIWDR